MRMETQRTIQMEEEEILKTYLQVWEQRIIHFTSDPNPNHNQDLQRFLPDFTLYVATHFPQILRAYTKYLMLYTTKVLNQSPNDSKQIYSLLEKICTELEEFIHYLDVDSDLAAILLQHVIVSKKQVRSFGHTDMIVSNFDVARCKQLWLKIEDVMVGIFQTQGNNWYTEVLSIGKEFADYVEDIPLLAGQVSIQFFIQELLREVMEPTAARTVVLGLLCQLCKETKECIERFVEKSQETQHLSKMLEDIKMQMRLYQLFSSDQVGREQIQYEHMPVKSIPRS